MKTLIKLWIWLLIFSMPAQSGDESMSTSLIKEINVNIAVKEIEPSLAFWKAVGFELTESVPIDGPDGSGPLGFAMFKNGTQSFMMQTVASLGEDIKMFKGRDLLASPVILFIIVTDIDKVEAALKDYEVAMERRETFYGSTEVGYFTPDGTNVTFAEFKETAP